MKKTKFRSHVPFLEDSFVSVVSRRCVPYTRGQPFFQESRPEASPRCLEDRVMTLSPLMRTYLVQLSLLWKEDLAQAHVLPLGNEESYRLDFKKGQLPEEVNFCSFEA